VLSRVLAIGRKGLAALEKHAMGVVVEEPKGTDLGDKVPKLSVDDLMGRLVE
jgi:hypothetical protein